MKPRELRIFDPEKRNMDAQLSLFTIPATASARVSDSPASHAAARRIERTGTAQSHRAVILAAVRACPGRTSKQLAQLTGLERHEVARRLPELRSDGAVYVAQIGEREMTWWPK